MFYSISKKIVAYGSIFLIGLSFYFLFGAPYAEAQYQPLTGIPGVTDTNNITLVGYVNALFLLSIALGAMLAVVKIALAGFSYMMSDVVTKKDSAKEQIRGALIGLGILLATFVVLYTINPNLTNLDVLKGAKHITLPGPDKDDTETIDTNACTKDPSSYECTLAKSAEECENNQPPGKITVKKVGGHEILSCTITPVTGKSWEVTTGQVFANAERKFCGSITSEDACQILFIGMGGDPGLPLPGDNVGSNAEEQKTLCAGKGGHMENEWRDDASTGSGFLFNVCVKK